MSYSIVYSLVAWLIILSILCAVGYVKHFNNCKPEEAETEKIGDVRYKEGQLQYYDTGTIRFGSVYYSDIGWYCMKDDLRESLGVSALKKQIECLESGGHELKYEDVLDSVGNAKEKGLFYIGPDSERYKYIFKCSKCDKEIKKTKDGLTNSERNALEKLNVIDKEKHS